MLKSAFKIVGLISIFIGFLIIISIYVFPVTNISGQETTLAQMPSLCGNVMLNVISVGSCGEHDPFYSLWVTGAVLIIAGLIEVLIGLGILIKNLI